MNCTMSISPLNLTHKIVANKQRIFIFKIAFFSTSKISYRVLSSSVKNIRFIEKVVFLHFLITSIVEIFGFAKVGLILSTHTQVNSTPIKKLIWLHNFFSKIFILFAVQHCVLKVRSHYFRFMFYSALLFI